jgi:hypothetical protein
MGCRNILVLSILLRHIIYYKKLKGKGLNDCKRVQTPRNEGMQQTMLLFLFWGKRV